MIQSGTGQGGREGGPAISQVSRWRQLRPQRSWHQPDPPRPLKEWGFPTRETPTLALRSWGRRETQGGTCGSTLQPRPYSGQETVAPVSGFKRAAVAKAGWSTCTLPCSRTRRRSKDPNSGSLESGGLGSNFSRDPAPGQARAGASWTGSGCGSERAGEPCSPRTQGAGRRHSTVCGRRGQVRARPAATREPGVVPPCADGAHLGHPRPAPLRAPLPSPAQPPTSPTRASREPPRAAPGSLGRFRGPWRDGVAMATGRRAGRSLPGRKWCTRPPGLPPTCQDPAVAATLRTGPCQLRPRT